MKGVQNRVTANRIILLLRVSHREQYVGYADTPGLLRFDESRQIPC